MLKMERANFLPLSVSVTTLSSNVASVNGAGVDATTDSCAPLTGTSAVRAGPPYPADSPCVDSEG